jgi:hypothetical protein
MLSAEDLTIMSEVFDSSSNTILIGGIPV